MLSDGFTALKILLEQDQDAFKFLTEFNLRHEYKENGQPGHHLHSVGTVIGKQQDPDGEIENSGKIIFEIRLPNFC